MNFHIFQRVLPFIINLLNVILLLILGYSLMHFGLLLNQPKTELSHNKHNNQAVKQAIKSNKQHDIQALLNNPLFGSTATEINTQQIRSSDAPLPETKLNLTLQGTLLFTEDKKHAKAIIAGPDGVSKSYGLNEKKPNIPGGAHLENIYADHIILSRNNKHESLRLQGGKNRTELLTQSQQKITTPDTTLSTRLTDYRNKILKQPNLMGNFIRVSPAQRNGKFLGYTLKPGKQKTLFEDTGLQTGDILTHLNGESLDSPLKGLRALQQLAEATMINLTVLRQDISIPLSLSLN